MTDTDARTYHLAQFNLARLKQPFDHPSIQGFRDYLDVIHDLADRSPGFVWRMKADGQTDSITLRPLGDDGIINFTVWESKDALAAFVYAGDHGNALRRRREWFHPASEINVVYWWIPAGTIPTLRDALAKLEMLRERGPTPEAFSFREFFPAPTANAAPPKA